MTLSQLRKLLVMFMVVSCIYSPVANAISAQERFYKRINTIEKLMGDKQYNEALSRLDKLYSSYKNRKHESGLVLQLYGYVYSQKGDSDKAIQYFQKCLAQKSLPVSALQNIRLNLIQLWIEKNEFNKAEKMFFQWQSSGKPLLPQGYALGGIIYANKKQYDKAVEVLGKAINLVKKPPEQWYQLLLSIYLDKKNYHKARNLLKNLVRQHPEKKKYWIRLADVSYLLNDFVTASSVMEVAKNKGFLKSEQELKKLAGFYFYAGIPYKAAMTIEYAINNKYMDKKPGILRRQAYYFAQAKSYPQAIKSLKEARKISADASLHYELAQLYEVQNDWENVRNVLSKITLEDNSDLNNKIRMLLGRALYEQGKYSQALTIFSELAKTKEEHQEAKQWALYTQQYIDKNN